MLLVDKRDQNNSFSTINDDQLAKMAISSSQVLQFKANAITRGLATNSVGEGEHWSANGLVRHLRALEGLVPRMVRNFVTDMP